MDISKFLWFGSSFDKFVIWSTLSDPEIHKVYIQKLIKDSVGADGRLEED